jgi:hypothetical protein
MAGKKSGKVYGKVTSLRVDLELLEMANKRIEELGEKGFNSYIAWLIRRDLGIDKKPIVIEDKDNDIADIIKVPKNKDKNILAITIKKKKDIIEENMEGINLGNNKFTFYNRICKYKNSLGEIVDFEVTDEMIDMMNIPGVNQRTFSKFDNPLAFKITKEYLNNNL